MIDTEALLTRALRAALDPVPVANTLDPETVAHPPFVLLTVLPGTAVAGLASLGWSHSVALAVYAGSRPAARALAREAYDAAHALTGTRSPLGYVGYVADVLTPTEIRADDAPDDLWQFSLTLRVTTCA